MRQLFIIVILFLFKQTSGQEIIAHAHNDYENERPLIDALSFGFQSIEVDIYEDNGTLKVSHFGASLSNKPTLRALYLDPLEKYLEENELESLWLLVDLKEDDRELLELLHADLLESRKILKSRTGNSNGPVQVLLSGSVDRELVKGSDKYEFFYLDGRISHLEEGWDPELMPLISSNLNKVVRWKGKGELSKKEKQKVMDLVKLVNAQGKRFRFWRTADTTESWDALVELGIDVIGTDDVEGLATFLRSRTN